MARFRYAPLQSNKKETTWSNLAQNASTVQTIALLSGADTADVDSGTEVQTGHKVTSMYFEFHFSAQTVTNPKVIHWQVVFQKVGETIASPATYYQDNRASISKRGMEMLPADTSTVFKRIFVVRVPKKFQRITRNALARFQYICSSTETINACGICIYKVYS